MTSDRSSPAPRRRWLRSTVLFALAASLGLAACARAPKPPAVILVSIDTLRADHVGLYGYGRDTTPFLDRWSKDATVFEHAFTTAAWTLVAHMTMLTGLFPEQHGVTGKRRALSPEIPLLAERLRAAGYRTIGLYTPGWIHERHGFQRGFDLFRAHQSLEEADLHLREVLDGLDPSKPFFLFLHVFDVHCGPFTKETREIYCAPEHYERMFLRPDAAPLPDRPAEELWETNPALDARQIETLVDTYDGGIREVDDQLALWFAELERRGLSQGALVIVTADHGEALAQRGKLQGHGDSFQEALHVPLIVRHPEGLAAGKRVAQPVHLGDLVPTILAVCGLPADERLPGRALFGPLPDERVVYGIKLPEAFVLRGAEKIVRGPKGMCLALDLAADPRELAPSSGSLERFEELRKLALGSSGKFPPALKIEEMSPEDEAKLLALGYGGESGEEAPRPPEEKASKPK